MSTRKSARAKKKTSNQCPPTDPRYPFLAVVHNNHQALRKWIQSGGDVNQCLDGRKSLLSFAVVKNETPECARLLLDAGANVDFKMENDGTAVALAVMGMMLDDRSGETLQLLLDCGADLDINGSDGLTVLELAEAIGKDSGNWLARDLIQQAMAKREAFELRLCLNPGQQLKSAPVQKRM